ncbi:MAG: hypothetical protein LBV47_05185 [Bacteroidales bacterium]|jgi:hypothetical protein|nr:hypothetical protein [Bacteroidales bacterium]
MKVLKFICLLLIVLTASSCDKKIDNDGPSNPFYDYMLLVNFQDTSDSNFLENLREEIVNESYTLDIISEDVIFLYYDMPNGLHNENLFISRGSDIGINSDYDDCLLFTTKSRKKNDDGKFPKKITFRLTFPYLFGDNDAHDIITWWEPYLHENGEETLYTVCYRMEFEGKELTVDGQHSEPLTIILDR